MSIYNVYDISYENILIYSLLNFFLCWVWYMSEGGLSYVKVGDALGKL